MTPNQSYLTTANNATQYKGMKGERNIADKAVMNDMFSTNIKRGALNCCALDTHHLVAWLYIKRQLIALKRLKSSNSILSSAFGPLMISVIMSEPGGKSFSK